MPALNISQVWLRTPPASQLHIAQVVLKAPAPPDPATIPVLHLSRVAFAAPAPAPPAVLHIGQVKLTAPRADSQPPSSGVWHAHSGNLHEAPIKTVTDGQL